MIIIKEISIVYWHHAPPNMDAKAVYIYRDVLPCVGLILAEPSLPKTKQLYKHHKQQEEGEEKKK